MKNKLLILLLLFSLSLSAVNNSLDTGGSVAYLLSEDNFTSTINVIDLSGNGNNGTSANTASFTTNQNGTPNFAQVLNGTSDKVTVGNIGSVKTITAWIYPETDDRSIFDLDGGTTSVEISSGDLSSTEWTSPTYYVNGVESATLTLNAWNHIGITSSTAETASAFVIGDEATWFDGNISITATYSDSKSATWFSDQYTAGLSGANYVITASDVASADDNVVFPAPDFWMPMGSDYTENSEALALDMISGNNGTVDGATVNTNYTTFTTDDYIDVGDTGRDGNTFGFWMYPTDVTDNYIIDFDGGTNYIWIEDESYTTEGTPLSTATIYIDGVVASTAYINTWQYIMITTATAFTVDDLDIGRVGASYYEGNLADLKIWSKVLSTEERDMWYGYEKANWSGE